MSMKMIGIIINVFFPGIGTIIVKQTGKGILQGAAYILGIVLTVSFILSVVGIPLMIGAWLWAIITTVNAPDDI